MGPDGATSYSALLMRDQVMIWRHPVGHCGTCSWTPSVCWFREGDQCPVWNSKKTKGKENFEEKVLRKIHLAKRNKGKLFSSPFLSLFFSGAKYLHDLRTTVKMLPRHLFHLIFHIKGSYNIT